MAACKKDTSPDIPRSQDGRSVILVVAIDCTKSRALAVRSWSVNRVSSGLRNEEGKSFCLKQCIHGIGNSA